MEFDRITTRGGVLGAMETGYQRSKIQEESMYYEMLKHTGEYPIVGVNTFRDPHADGADMLEGASCIDLARATTEEKESQLNRLKDFPFPSRGPGTRGPGTASAGGPLRREHFCRTDGNGQMLQPGADHRCALRRGGQYRRNM
jgi:methylmalonyl-CoA mutase